MKRFLVIAILLFPVMAYAAPPLLLDDSVPENHYYTSDQAAKNWEAFSEATNNAFGYGSRETTIIFGDITGGQCKENKSWLALAFGRYPQHLQKGILHVDAVCNGAHITGTLDYGSIVGQKDNYYDAASGKGEPVHAVLRGMLTSTDKNVEGVAEVKFDWKWKDDAPDMETTGDVVLSQVHNILPNLPDFTKLGTWKAKTINWYSKPLR